MLFFANRTRDAIGGDKEMLLLGQKPDQQHFAV